MARRAERMSAALEAAFAPEELIVEDQSARHAGHAGASPEGESHFRVRIVAERFRGLSRLERSRLVHAALSDEFDDGLHALSVEADAPIPT